MEKGGPPFLTEEEVNELTGIGTGKTDFVDGQSMKRTKLELQVVQLQEMRIPFRVNARGRPLVARAFFDGPRSSRQPLEKKSQPKALQQKNIR
jgi:hypothetical protein